MIRINLSKMLGEKRITQTELSRKTGIRPNTISDLYNGFAIGIKFKNLDLICEILECDVSDLIERIPDEAKELNN